MKFLGFLYFLFFTTTKKLQLNFCNDFRSRTTENAFLFFFPNQFFFISQIFTPVFLRINSKSFILTLDTKSPVYYVMYIVVVTFHLDFSCNCYENCLLIFIQRSKFIKMVDVRFFVALRVYVRAYVCTCVCLNKRL